MSFLRILVAVDEGAIAAHAAAVAGDLARTLGAELAFVYVVDPGHVVGPGTGVPAGELLRWAKQDGKRVLTGFRERGSFESPPLEFISVGKPSTEIVKAAVEWPADLIVIGSHGRSGLDRLLSGSVAEEVMRHASCDVLIVRSPAPGA